MGELGTPDYIVQTRDRLFKADPSLYRDTSPAETVDMMDEAGVGKAIVTVKASSPSRHVLSFVEHRPDRFALGAEVDPDAAVRSAKELTALAAAHPLVLARVIPFYSGLAPCEPPYYVIYAKCIELGLPVTVNTGIPGPPAEAACQHPAHLERACLDFPELKLVMAHGADPWWDLAQRLMLKYSGLYLMTSAYLPKYLPASLVHFMDRRAPGKVIYASDHPAIPMARCLEEARALTLGKEAMDAYLGGNAERLFFKKAEPTPLDRSR